MGNVDAARNMKRVGYLTWLLIAIPSVVWEISHRSLATPRALLWLALFIAFLPLFAICTREQHRHVFVWLTLLTIIGLACSYLQPVGFQPVLLVIVAGSLGGTRAPIAVTWITAQSVALGAVAISSGNPFTIASAYFAFGLFAFFTARIAHNEREARVQLAQTNAELRVATELLQINSRADERLRIARDLHDLLGHHLTALSLNLEVASHLTEGPAREHVDKSKAITKLLLSDVRGVVSALRQDERVDLTAAVESLRDAVAHPAMHVEIDGDVAVPSAAIAQTALRALQEIVTNSVRHSGARNLWLRVACNDGVLSIDARDDGSGADSVHFGNGLTGMRERVEELHGSMRVTASRGRGFEVHVTLPITGAST
jgi:signal transduction histidine kinase